MTKLIKKKMKKKVYGKEEKERCFDYIWLGAHLHSDGVFVVFALVHARQGTSNPNLACFFGKKKDFKKRN